MRTRGAGRGAARVQGRHSCLACSNVELAGSRGADGPRGEAAGTNVWCDGESADGMRAAEVAAPGREPPEHTTGPQTVWPPWRGSKVKAMEGMGSGKERYRTQTL